MDILPVNMKSHWHARANSLPSVTYKVSSQFNEHLFRLKNSEAASSSSSSIMEKLNNLQHLHGSIKKLLLLSLIQQTLAKEQNEEINKQLDESLRFLDTCGMAEVPLLQLRNHYTNFNQFYEDKELKLERSRINTWQPKRWYKRA